MKNRIEELEALLKFADARINVLIGKLSEAQEKLRADQMTQQLAAEQNTNQMGNGAAQQEVQPYAVLVFERGEEGPFDRKPVRPGSVQHLHAKRDPHHDYIELYAHPAQQGLELDAAQAAKP